MRPTKRTALGRGELEEAVALELRQREEEGFDIGAIREAYPDLTILDDTALKEVNASLSGAEMRPDFRFVEPTGWKEILGASPGVPELLDTDLVDSDLFDKLHGGWLGGCVGGERGHPSVSAIDDLVARLRVLEEHGLEFASEELWDALAEISVNGSSPPTVAGLSPIRERIDAVPCAVLWGYVYPGQPRAAAELAFRDAARSFTKNGVYGALFVAAAVSAAFSISDVDEIVHIGLGMVPTKSRLADAVRNVIVWHERHEAWEGTHSIINDSYGHYDRTHTIPNLCWMVLGLLYGRGDFERSLRVARTCSTDTDSTAATLGSLLGVIHESHGVPERLRDTLGDRIKTRWSTQDGVRISELARRTLDVVRKLGTNP